MCTLLFQAHLDMAYWVEALHTATYLFNRRPSLPLHLHTPYEALFLQPPDYSHLRTFGCLCFPNLSAIAPHKLAPHSMACVFIGYSWDHKGYCFLNLSSHKVITSRHVIFDELVFPLQQRRILPRKPHESPSTDDPCIVTWDLIPVRWLSIGVDPP
jgi:hypothetical protein